ncbi:hypothetical protein GCM10023196_098180 [Actinoallomurus vinaceus]|uniref:HNH endonuclease n=1 Tax=Actinoallomurus vinaceus TaxID=1080074 RepID=A0ABP8UUF3_9ACTN
MHVSEVFFREDPTPRASWRLAVLMGANSRTYKFALGEALLELAGTGRTDAPLTELARPYAMRLVRHLEEAPQAPAVQELRDTDFLAIARREAAESVRLGQPTEALIRAAVQSMPAMVMQKFTNVPGGTTLPHRFYELTGAPRERIVRFTPEMQRLAMSEHADVLRGELGARWAIVESSFSTGVGASLMREGVAVDLQTLALTDKRRRRAITGVKEATIGFQHGRCLICNDPLAAEDPYAIDHVFAFSYMERMGGLRGWQGPDLDAIWNLAPVHDACNSAKSNRLPTPDEQRRLAQRNEAIQQSPHPLKKTLQLTLSAWKYDSSRPANWFAFIGNVYRLLTN